MSIEEPQLELSDEDIAAGHIRSDELLAELVERIEDVEEDSGVVLFSLWIKIAFELIACGWRGEELTSEIASHAALFESEGTA